MIYGFDRRLRQLDYMARLIIPQILLAGLLCLSFVSVPLPAMGAVKPHLVLMAVYYWSIYRPTIVPPYLCFTLGLITDVIGSTPLGLNALILIVVRWIVSDQRRFLMGQPYISIWAVFVLVATVESFVQWVLLGLASGLHWVPLLPVAASALVSFFLFPFITLLLVFTHRLLPVASRAIP